MQSWHNIIFLLSTFNTYSNYLNLVGLACNMVIIKKYVQYKVMPIPDETHNSQDLEKTITFIIKNGNRKLHIKEHQIPSFITDLHLSWQQEQKVLYLVTQKY